MNIESLVVHITDSDLNDLIERYALADEHLDELSARIETGGVVLTGTARWKARTVSFEATLAPAVDGTAVVAVLSRLKALGGLAGIFKGTIVKMITRDLADIPGLTSIKNGVRFDSAVFMTTHGMTADIRRLTLTTGPGSLRLELAAGASL